LYQGLSLLSLIWKKYNFSCFSLKAKHAAILKEFPKYFKTIENKGNVKTLKVTKLTKYILSLILVIICLKALVHSTLYWGPCPNSSLLGISGLPTLYKWGWSLFENLEHLFFLF
jgi:hypothetical protein